MKNLSIYPLVLLASFLFSCGRSMDPSSAAYNSTSLSTAYRAASTRHYQLSHGQTPTSDQEWLTLIGEFQRIIDMDAQGEWADDAQYAIGSSWMWLRQSNNNSTATQKAIDAFKKLLQDYPDSPHAAEAHHWLGNCYALLEDENQAITHYQTVIRLYLSNPISDDALLHLGRTYERQGYLASAMATYQALSQRSQDPQLIFQTKKRITYLQAKEAIVSKHGDVPPKIIEAGQLQPVVLEGPLAQSTEATSQPVNVPPPTIATEENADSSFKSVETSKPPFNPSLAQQLGLNVKTIVLDPGHGGKDPGAMSQIAGQEKDIVLSISGILRDLLVEKGYQVRLTRDTDVYIPLNERTQFAAEQEADLFISIHVNASTSASGSGIETYMESKSAESFRLAHAIQEQLIFATQAKDRGVKHAPFVVLIGTRVPAVLIEVGFMSNPTEGRKLTTEDYQRQLAQAIVKGIEQYITGIPLANASVN